MSFSRSLLVFLFRTLSDAVFRVHAGPLAGVPQKGPLIIVMNHINILEIPTIYSRLQPWEVRGLVLADRWKNRAVAWGLDACGAIPLQRGVGNLELINKILGALDAGEIVLIMPEGTRSGTGQLQSGYPGVVLLAQKSKAPILPIVTYGGEGYKPNLRRLRRTDFYIALGKTFTVKEVEGKSGNQVRKQVLDEMMFQLAALLPPAYRGSYNNLPAEPPKYLEFC